MPPLAGQSRPLLLPFPAPTSPQPLVDHGKAMLDPTGQSKRESYSTQQRAIMGPLRPNQLFIPDLSDVADKGGEIRTEISASRGIGLLRLFGNSVMAQPRRRGIS
ncbi:hypothetical protein KM043_007064 [Ampulex compressa]|nr:hypothetical protein KM043_007064 [Ampulex compressa]